VTETNQLQNHLIGVWGQQQAVLGGAWNSAGALEELNVQLSHRLTRALGCSYPSRALIRIAARVVDGPRALLEEVLAHEAAHVVVFKLHGRSTRPHGPEWAELMRQAGFKPRRTMPAGELGWQQPLRRRKRVSWRHTCPVCHSMRMAGRPVREWACAACREAGLTGELIIERVAVA